MFCDKGLSLEAEIWVAEANYEGAAGIGYGKTKEEIDALKKAVDDAKAALAEHLEKCAACGTVEA